MDALYVGLILLFAILSMIGLTVCVRRLGHKCLPILRNCKAMISQRQQQSRPETKTEKVAPVSKNPFSHMLHRSSITPTRQNLTKVDIHVESASDKNLSELLKPSTSFDDGRRASREDKICLLIKRASELHLQSTSGESYGSPKLASRQSSIKKPPAEPTAGAARIGGELESAVKPEAAVAVTVAPTEAVLSPTSAECSIALATAETSCDESDDDCAFAHTRDAVLQIDPKCDPASLPVVTATAPVPVLSVGKGLPVEEVVQTRNVSAVAAARVPALFASPFNRRRNRPSFTFAYSQDFADNGVDEDRLLLQICPVSPNETSNSSGKETSPLQKTEHDVKVTGGMFGKLQSQSQSQSQHQHQQQSNSLEEKNDRLMPLHPFHRQKPVEHDENSPSAAARENGGAATASAQRAIESKREIREKKLQRFIKSMDIDSDSDSMCSSKVSTASSRPKLQHELSIPTDSGVSCTLSSNVSQPPAALATYTTLAAAANEEKRPPKTVKPPNDKLSEPPRRQKRLTFAHNRSQSNYESGEVPDAVTNKSNVVIEIRQLTEEKDDKPNEKPAPTRTRSAHLLLKGISKQRSVDSSNLQPLSLAPLKSRDSSSDRLVDVQLPAAKLSVVSAPVCGAVVSTSEHSPGGNENENENSYTESQSYSSRSSTPDVYADAEYDSTAELQAHALQSRADELLRALTQTVLLSNSRSQQGLNLPASRTADRGSGLLLDPNILLSDSLSASSRCCACHCHHGHHSHQAACIDPQSLLLVQTVLPLMLRNSLSSLRKKRRRRSRTRQHSKSSNALHADSHSDRSSLRVFDDGRSIGNARSTENIERNQQADTSKDDSSNSGTHSHTHSHDNGHGHGHERGHGHGKSQGQSLTQKHGNSKQGNHGHHGHHSSHGRRPRPTPRGAVGNDYLARVQPHQNQGQSQHAHPSGHPLSNQHPNPIHKAKLDSKMRSSVSSATDDSIYSRSGHNGVLGRTIWNHDDDDNFGPHV